MHATDDSSDEGASDDEDIQNSLAKTSRPTSGDDLGDSFSSGKDLMDKKGWVDNIYDQNDTDNQAETGSSSQDSEGDEDEEEDENADCNHTDGDDTSDDECKKISTVRDWEQSDEDELDMNAEEAENHDSQGASNCERQNMDLCEINAKSAQRTNASPKLATDGGKEIPYVIEAPKTLTELCSLLDNRSDDEVLEIINRIRAYNSIKLAAENRKKMQVCFYPYYCLFLSFPYLLFAAILFFLFILSASFTYRMCTINLHWVVCLADLLWCTVAVFCCFSYSKSIKH